MKFILVLSSLAVIVSSAKLEKLGKLCGCRPDRRPVCASNYKTYSNECEMGCDPVNPQLIKLYDGRCIMADSSAEARDQYASRQGLQYNREQFSQAEQIARQSEDDNNSAYDAIVKMIRLRQGKDKVVSLKDRQAEDIRIENESRKAKGQIAAIRDQQKQILQRQEQNTQAQVAQNAQITSRGSTSSDQLKDYDHQVNSQPRSHHHNSYPIAKRAEDQARQVEIDAQKVHVKAVNVQADANKAQERTRQLFVKEKVQSLAQRVDKKELETEAFQAQAKQAELNARNAKIAARVVQVEARQVEEKARQAAKYAGDIEMQLQSRESSLDNEEALKIVQQAKRRAGQAKQKARKAEERAKKAETQARQAEKQAHQALSDVFTY